jgi:hypothetical protein
MTDNLTRGSYLSFDIRNSCNHSFPYEIVTEGIFLLDKSRSEVNNFEVIINDTWKRSSFIIRQNPY